MENSQELLKKMDGNKRLMNGKLIIIYQNYINSAEIPLLQMAFLIGTSSSKSPFFTAHLPL